MSWLQCLQRIFLINLRSPFTQLLCFSQSALCCFLTSLILCQLWSLGPLSTSLNTFQTHSTLQSSFWTLLGHCPLCLSHFPFPLSASFSATPLLFAFLTCSIPLSASISCNQLFSLSYPDYLNSSSNSYKSLRLLLAPLLPFFAHSFPLYYIWFFLQELFEQQWEHSLWILHKK